MGVGDAWGTREELLHPRDRHGRFREKWKMAEGVVNKLLDFLGRFNPKTFQSDQQSAQYALGRARSAPTLDYRQFAAGFPSAQRDLQAGEMTPDTKRFVSMMDRSMRPTEDDLILHRSVRPEAFGLTPETMGAEEGGIQDLTGKVLREGGYSSTNIGTPMGQGPIRMTIATPKGTRAAYPGRSQGDREVVLDRGQDYRITRVTPDGQGGYHVLAVIEPSKEQAPAKPLQLGQQPAAPGMVRDLTHRPGQQPAPEGAPAAPVATPAAPQAPVQTGRPGRPAAPAPPPRTEPVVSESIGTTPGAPEAPKEPGKPSPVPSPGAPVAPETPAPQAPTPAPPPAHIVETGAGRGLPSTFFPGTAKPGDRGRVRQMEIDRRVRIADAVAQIEEAIHAAGGSTNRVRVADVRESTKAALEDYLGRTPEADDLDRAEAQWLLDHLPKLSKEQIQRSAARMADRVGMQQVGTPGDRRAYSPRDFPGDRYRVIGPQPEEGQLVELISPGYSFRHDGETIVVKKGEVLVPTRTAPKKSVTKQSVVSKLSPGQSREFTDLSTEEQRSYLARRRAGRSHAEALESAKESVADRNRRLVTPSLPESEAKIRERFGGKKPTVTELREEAKKQDIKLPGRATRAQIIDTILNPPEKKATPEAPKREKTVPGTSVPIRKRESLRPDTQIAETQTRKRTATVPDTPLSEEQRSAFKQAYIDAKLQAGMSAGERNAETSSIYRDIRSGRLTPREAVRKLEDTILSNHEELRRTQTALTHADHGEPGSRQREMFDASIAGMKTLRQDIAEQEKVADWLEKYFSDKSPTGDVKPGTLELPADVHEALSKAKVADLRQQAKTMGIRVPGTARSKQQIIEHIVKEMARKELIRRGELPESEAKVPPVKRVAPKASVQAVSLDDIIKESGADTKLLDELPRVREAIQHYLNGDSSHLRDANLPEDASAAQIGRHLEQMIKGAGGPYHQSAVNTGISVERGRSRLHDAKTAGWPKEEVDRLEKRLLEDEAESRRLRDIGDEWMKVAERLKKMRRPARRSTIPSPNLEDQARARHAEIQDRRKIATIAAEVQGMIFNDSDERTIRSRIETVAKIHKIDDATRDRLLADAGDPKKLAETARRMAREAGLTPIGEHGQSAIFDPAKHESIEGIIRPGDKVGIEEVGYSVKMPDGQVIQLAKAKVSPYDRKLHGPLLEAPSRSNLREPNPAILHPDSALAELRTKVLKESNDQEIDLANRITALGENLGVGQGTSSHTLEQLKEWLKDPRYGKYKTLIQEAISAIDRPRGERPKLPGSTDPRLVRFVNDLYEIPLAHKPTSTDQPSLLERAVKIVQDFNAEDARPVRLLSKLHQLSIHYHESNEGWAEIRKVLSRVFGDASDIMQRRIKEMKGK